MAFAFTCVFACGEKEEEKTVAIEETAISLEVGEEKMLQASKSEGVELEWSSSDAKVATVSNGKVTAVGAGQAVITVTIKGTDIKDEVTVTVTKSAVVASKVEVSGPTKVEIGSTAQYKATVTPANAEGTVAWSVSDAAIAEIDQTGKFTAKAVGSVKVVATIGEVKAEYAVTVSDIAPVEPTEIQLWVNGAQIENGGTLEVTEFDVVQLEFKYLPADKPVLEGVDVASGNEYTVAIDEEYKLTAVAPGDTYVLVSSIYADIEFSINVHVVEKHFAPESIVISGDAKLEVNEEGLVSAVVSPERASQEVVWSSSDEAIAVVDPVTGVVTGKGIGKATITAKSTEVETVVATYEVEIVAEVAFDRTLIYVNPAYTNKGEKVTVDGKELIVGKNAVDTVAKALKNVAEGGQIVLAAGVYADAITFNKNNVTILGPNAGVNAAEAERAEEANLAGQITVAAGVTGAAIDGVLLSDSGAVLLEDGVDGFALQYCVIGGIGQDGVVRGPDAETEVKNIKMNYNYSESYTSYRFGHFRGVINGIEMIGNNLTCKGSYDFINVGGVLKGTVVIENNTYTNSNQSFIYVSNVGVLDCTISGNIITNITSTFIDLRNMKEDGAVKIDIYDNEFKDSVIGWMPIRIRTADYDANDSIVVNVYDNIFSEAFAPDDDGINYYINNPSYDAQVDPFKAIYVIGKNLFIENGQVVTEVNNTQFCNAAISFETPYASLEEMNGGASTPELPQNAAELLQKFADEIVELFNNVPDTIDGAAKKVTTQDDFTNTTHPNVKGAFGTAENLAAYKWFLEFALETTAAACEANGKADSDMLTQYNSVADYKGMIQAMINGDTTAISGSYADGRTAFRQYIHRLINVYNTNATAGNTAYNDFTVDFANDQAALAKFLQLYLAQQEPVVLSLDKVIVAPAFEKESFKLDDADYQVGVNAFTTLEEAIAAVNENGVVSVLAGEYVIASTITINKTISILGPNHEVAADARVEEAIINPVADESASEYSFLIEASNVVISGLKFTSDKAIGQHNRRAVMIDKEIENVTFTYNYLLNFNTAIEYGDSLKLKGALNINNNIFDGHGQFIVWLAPSCDLSEFAVLNICDNVLKAPQDTSFGQFAYGAISMRHEGASCEVNILRNVFDFAGSVISQYFIRVCSGKLTISENTFINLEAGKLFGGVTTTDWTVKGNTYLDAEGNAVAAPELGNGVEEFVPATEITVDPNGEVKSIAEALEKIAEGGTITVLAGTYADALTIDKAVTILGPNAGKSGLATDRAEEAVINASIVIAAEGVTIDGVKLDVDANVEFQAGKAKLANVYSLASNCIATAAINRTAVLYATAEVSDIEILDSYFNIGAASYLKGVWASGVEVANITFKGNYFTHESTDNTSISDCIAMYAVAGELNFVNNHFVWVTDDWDLFIGYNSNKCTVVNIIENTFDGVGELYTCGNTVRKLQEGAVCNVIGNTFNTLAGTIFSSNGSVAGAVINIKYNAYMNCKYKQGATDATCNIENNYYALEQTTATADYGVIKSKEELDAAYGASDASTDLFISEYCEGSSNNKYLEIYNGTGADVDLANYQLWSYANGSTELNNYSVAQLEGIIKAGDVFVVSNSSAKLQDILDNSDQNSSNAVNFNGDDAVALVKKNAEGGYDIVDLFGVIGEDPGKAWAIGDYETVDNTIVRNPDVKNPSATWNPAEWTVLGKDVTTDCGKHTVE